MDKLTDIRFYTTPEYKKRIKQIALEKNISVNKMINQIVHKEIPEFEYLENRQNLENELKETLKKLSNSANMSTTERQQLKDRKDNIKSLLKIINKKC